MNNKLFVGLLIAILVVGAGVGGAFAGGVAYERGQDDTLPVVTTSALPSPSGTQSNSTSAGDIDVTNIRERIQSGDITTEEIQQIRQQFRERFQGQGGGGGGGGFAGLGAGAGNGSRMGGRGGGLTGTIESVTDGLITVDTPQGPLQATIGSDTVIRSLVEVSVEDLVIDKRVTVTGERSEDGIIKANSILIRPGGSGFGGAGTSN